MPTMRHTLAAALLAGLLAGSARAQAPVVQVSIGGQVERPTTYTMTALAALPAVEVQAAREVGGMSSVVGPLHWPMLEAAKPIDGPARSFYLQHVLRARGADGYAVALAIGEIDPGSRASRSSSPISRTAPCSRRRA